MSKQACKTAILQKSNASEDGALAFRSLIASEKSVSPSICPTSVILVNLLQDATRSRRLWPGRDGSAKYSQDIIL